MKKIRKYPDKKQNNYSEICPSYEGTWCHEEEGHKVIGKNKLLCEGNKHNCIKQKYKKLASI